MSDPIDDALTNLRGALYAAFIDALEASKALVRAKGSIDERLTEMRDMIARLETLVLAQGDELRRLRNGDHDD